MLALYFIFSALWPHLSYAGERGTAKILEPLAVIGTEDQNRTGDSRLEALRVADYATSALNVKRRGMIASPELVLPVGL